MKAPPTKPELRAKRIDAVVAATGCSHDDAAKIDDAVNLASNCALAEGEAVLRGFDFTGNLPLFAHAAFIGTLLAKCQAIHNATREAADEAKASTQ